MTLIWITDSDQGSFIAGQNLTVSPVTLEYLAPSWATVSLHSGELPYGLTWAASNGYLNITGTIDPNIIPDTFEFTFRLYDPTDDSHLDRTFRMAVLTSPVPTWYAPSNLGTYSENHSFNLYPLTLDYDAVSGAKVTLLNGRLPPGLYWTVSGNSIVITGESDDLTDDLHAEWTFRIKNPNGPVADRTFTMTLMALANIPSWLGQDQFLGYMPINTPSTFSVSATVPGTIPPTYSIVSPIPAGMSIDAISGVISYSPEGMVSDEYIYFTVRASTSSTYSDLEVLIIALTVPHVPMWITKPGLVRTPQLQYLELPLQAFDSSGGDITYSKVSEDPGFPFDIDSDGLLFGMAPAVDENTTWDVVLGATTVYGTATLSLTIEVTKVNTLGVLRWRNQTVEYTGMLDGTAATYDVGAISTRTRTIKHGITGGQVPPGLVLDKIQGYLVGYVDYHTIPKDYWFDVTATDGVDTLVRTIHMHVSPRYGYQFMDVSLPLHGDVRQRWIDVNHYMLDDTRMLVNVSVENNQYDFPSMSIIRGLDHTMRDPKEILMDVMPSIQRMDLSIGPMYNVTVDNNGSQLFYRSVIDPQDGARFVALHQGSPPTINTNSLQGIRDAFARVCDYASAGGGSGASAFVLTDPEQGSITGIYVTNSGSGYTNTPTLVINGAGTGASAHAMSKINGMKVIDSSLDWVLGEQFYIELGVYDRPARLIASDVDPSGRLVSVQFIDGGSYYRIPAGKVLIRNGAGSLNGVSFRMGIDEVRLTDGGVGYYGTTTVDFGGGEQLHGWQESWTPYMPVALINPSMANVVIANSQAGISRMLDGAIWQADQLCMSVQGLYYQGSTTFDDGFVGWDGGTTRFEESLTPLQTIFDENDQTLDLMETTFDAGPPTPRDARDNWGLTLIDEGTTAFEFYATIFDAATPRRESSTMVRRYVRLPMPQISGNNVDGTSPQPSNR